MKSKSTPPIAKSPMKSSVSLLTQYVRKGSSDYDAKAKEKVKIWDALEDDAEWNRRVEATESIEKEEEPVLSQVSDKESDNDTIKYDSEGDDANRTYELEDKLEDSSVHSASNVVYENARLCPHISEEEEPVQTSDSGTAKEEPTPPVEPEKLADPDPAKKISIRPRKCQSLPNVDGAREMPSRHPGDEVESTKLDKLPPGKELMLVYVGNLTFLRPNSNQIREGRGARLTSKKSFYSRHHQRHHRRCRRSPRNWKSGTCTGASRDPRSRTSRSTTTTGTTRQTNSSATSRASAPSTHP